MEIDRDFSRYSVTKPERLAVDWVKRILSRIGKTAGVVVDEGDPRTGRGIKYASTHDLQRTFAVRLKRSGMPPDLMRHADFRTTEKYYLCDTIQEDAGRIREILSTVTQNRTQIDVS